MPCVGCNIVLSQSVFTEEDCRPLLPLLGRPLSFHPVIVLSVLLLSHRLLHLWDFTELWWRALGSALCNHLGLFLLMNLVRQADWSSGQSYIPLVQAVGLWTSSRLRKSDVGDVTLPAQKKMFRLPPFAHWVISTVSLDVRRQEQILPTLIPHSHKPKPPGCPRVNPAFGGIVTDSSTPCKTPEFTCRAERYVRYI